MATGRSARRGLHVVVLLLLTLVGAAVLGRLLPTATPTRSSASIVLAYTSLGSILLTLSIGPVNVLRGRPNPRSTDLRRDVGLWAAATGSAHVVLSLGNHFGGSIRTYFFADGEVALETVRRDTFGVGTWSGVAATAVLVGLAVISNDRSVRRLGRRWKQLQRWNYGLVLVALVHTGLFWVATDRRGLIWAATSAAAVCVAGLQLAGLRGTVRARRDRPEPAGKPVTS